MILRIKKKRFYFVLFIIIFFVATFLIFFQKHKSQINYKISQYEENENYTIKKAVYTNFGKEIYGFLLEPNVKGKVSGIVLLPGAGVDKMSELPLAKELAQQGYAVITIDQRGTGETDGKMSSFEEDFNDYKNGNIPTQRLMISDALAAADVLRNQEKVYPDNLVMMGESLGGRIALISTSLDKNIKGAIAISTAGFHSYGNDEKSEFINSFDPDNYISKISPRKVFMLHNYYDRNVPFQSALITFEKAKEPKKFILVNDTNCNHGFCQSMFKDINSSLASIVG